MKLTENDAEILVGQQGSSVVIPEIFTSIGIHAFSNYNLTSVDIPIGVTAIGDYSFSYNQLTSLDIPNSVKSIGVNAFGGNRLTNLEIPSSVTSLGSSAFHSNLLANLNIPENLSFYDESNREVFDTNRLTSVRLPNGITVVPDSYFARNKLTNVSIPHSVTEIGSEAFTENQLRTVEFSDNLKTIEKWAFSHNKLKSINLPVGLTSIGDGAFFNNQLKRLILPDTITSIGEDAFSNNSLESVVIPDSVYAIGESAFEDNKLRKVELPEFTTLGPGAFDANVEIIRRRDPVMPEGTEVKNITNNITNNNTTLNINNSGSGNVTVGDVGSVTNTTTIDNIFTLQITTINLSLAITGEKRKSEKVEGTPGADLIVDGQGKDRLIGHEGADQFYFSGKEPFKKKLVDKVMDFDSSEGDVLLISEDIIDDLGSDPTLAIADSKKDVGKLAKNNFDLIYFEPKGDLYVDGNGQSRGFGNNLEGGLLADLPKNTSLSDSDILIGA